jgi:TPR repeat protein
LAEQYYKDQSYDQAVPWYRKAAEQGHAGAQYTLGTMYDRGWGVAKDMTQAAEWYRRAAKQGYAMAQDELRRRGLSW